MGSTRVMLIFWLVLGWCGAACACFLYLAEVRDHHNGQRRADLQQHYSSTITDLLKIGQSRLESRVRRLSRSEALARYTDLGEKIKIGRQLRKMTDKDNRAAVFDFEGDPLAGVWPDKTGATLALRLKDRALRGKPATAILLSDQGILALAAAPIGLHSDPSGVLLLTRHLRPADPARGARFHQGAPPLHRQDRIIVNLPVFVKGGQGYAEFPFSPPSLTSMFPVRVWFPPGIFLAVSTLVSIALFRLFRRRQLSTQQILDDIGQIFAGHRPDDTGPVAGEDLPEFVREIWLGTLRERDERLRYLQTRQEKTRQLLAVDDVAWRLFSASVLHQGEEFESGFASYEQMEQDEQRTFTRQLAAFGQTVNDASRIFHMEHVAVKSAHFMQILQHVTHKTGGSGNPVGYMKKCFDEVRAEIDAYTELRHDLLGHDADTTIMTHMPDAWIHWLRCLAGRAFLLLNSRTTTIRDIRRLHREFDQALSAAGKADLRNYLDGFDRLLTTIGTAAGKRLAPLVHEGNCFFFSTRIMPSLHGILLRGFKYAATGGIEGPGKREKEGKSPEGHIRLITATSGDVMEIFIEDDGRGHPGNPPSAKPATENPELRGISDLAEGLGGTLSTLQTDGQGSVLRVSLPLERRDLVPDWIIFDLAALVRGITRDTTVARGTRTGIEALPNQEGHILVFGDPGFLAESLGDLFRRIIRHSPPGCRYRLSLVHETLLGERRPITICRVVLTCNKGKHLPGNLLTNDDVLEGALQLAARPGHHVYAGSHGHSLEVELATRLPPQTPTDTIPVLTILRENDTILNLLHHSLEERLGGWPFEIYLENRLGEFLENVGSGALAFVDAGKLTPERIERLSQHPGINLVILTQDLGALDPGAFDRLLQEPVIGQYPVDRSLVDRSLEATLYSMFFRDGKSSPRGPSDARQAA